MVELGFTKKSVLQVDCDVVREACMSLDAGTAALIVMSAANMPTQVLNEAVISPVAEAIKHHLFINVLSKHSAQIRNLHAQGKPKSCMSLAPQLDA